MQVLFAFPLISLSTLMFCIIFHLLATLICLSSLSITRMCIAFTVFQLQSQRYKLLNLITGLGFYSLPWISATKILCQQFACNVHDLINSAMFLRRSVALLVYELMVLELNLRESILSPTRVYTVQRFRVGLFVNNFYFLRDSCIRMFENFGFVSLHWPSTAKNEKHLQ